MRFHLLALALAAVAAVNPADEEVARLLTDLRATGKAGAGSPAARAAWDRLVARGPAVLPRLLEALDTPDTVAANWLRTAFDRVATAALKDGGAGIDADALLAFAKEPKHQGRARRLALEVVDRLRPGTSAGLLPGWLEDPEFRYDAVALVMKEAETLDGQGRKEVALAALRKAFVATRDLPQAKTIASRLKALGVTVSLGEHFGFLRDWYVIGPFDARSMTGFQTAYPPEERIDLAAEYDGRAGKVHWKHFLAAEPAPAALDAVRGILVNLREPIGDADDAVAYAYTAFTVPAAREVEFRGAADDNFTVWVNGRRAFGFEEYRNGVRLDRHRFRVTLRAGQNTVLVKVCQAPANGEPNWEFVLRVVDETGKGIPLENALPAK